MWKFALVLLFLSCFGHGRRSLRSHQQRRNGIVHDGGLHSQSRAQAGPHGTLGTLNACARLLRAFSSPAAFTAGSRGQHLLRRTSPALHTAAMRVCLPVQASTDIPAFFPAVPEFCCETCGFTIFPAFGDKQNVLNDKFRCPTCGTAKDDFFEVADMSDPRAVKARETGLPRIAAAQAPPLATNQEAQGQVASPEEAPLPSPPKQDQSPAPAAEGFKVTVRKKTKTDESPAPAVEGREVKVRKKTEFDFTEQQMAQFQAAFTKLDLNGDGTIEAKELGAMMTSLGYSYSEAELQAIINDFDANGNGSLEFPEFLSLMARKMKEDKAGKLQQEPAPPASTEEAPPPTSPKEELKQEVEKLQQAPAPPLEQVAQEVEQDTEEEEEESDDAEHEFRCEKCGYTLFPARGREGKFFPDDFKCMMCKAPKDAFFDMADLSDPRTVAALEEEGYEVVTEEEVAAEEKAAGLPVEDEIAEKKDEGYAHSQAPETSASDPSAEDQSPTPAAEGLEIKVRKKTETDESPAPAAEGLETKTDESPAPAAEELETKVRKKTETDQSPAPAAEGLEVKVRKKAKTDQSPAPAAEGLETKTDESPAPAAEGLEIKVRKKTESAAQPSAGSSEAIAPPASPEASETAPPHEDRYRGGVRPPVDNWSAFENYPPPPVHQLSRRQDPNADKDLWQQAETKNKVTSTSEEGLESAMAAFRKKAGVSPSPAPSPPMPSEAKVEAKIRSPAESTPAPSLPVSSEAKVETKIRSPAESTPAPSPPVSSEAKVEAKIRPPSPRVPAEGDSESNIQTGTAAPSPPRPAEGGVRVKIRRPKKD